MCLEMVKCLCSGKLVILCAEICACASWASACLGAGVNGSGQRVLHWWLTDIRINPQVSDTPAICKATIRIWPAP